MASKLPPTLAVYFSLTATAWNLISSIKLSVKPVMMFVLPPTTPVPCKPATKSNGLALSKIGVSNVIVHDGFLGPISAVSVYKACERAAV